MTRCQDLHAPKWVPCVPLRAHLSAGGVVARCARTNWSTTSAITALLAVLLPPKQCTRHFSTRLNLEVWSWVDFASLMNHVRGYSSLRWTVASMISCRQKNGSYRLTALGESRSYPHDRSQNASSFSTAVNGRPCIAPLP